jgi:ABC-type glycerol-3-phosphate transport system substrate-binding protein
MYQENGYLNPIWACRYNELCTYRSIPFGTADSFEPVNIVSINANTANQQLAKDFVEELFAPNEQAITGSNSFGIPVNREGLRDLIGESHGVVTGPPYNATLVMDYFFESQQEYDIFLEYLNSFQYAANMDEQVQGVLLNQLETYMNGEISLEDYLSGVKAKMEVYLSE